MDIYITNYFCSILFSLCILYMKFAEKLFTNKMFLYVVLILTILTVLGYIAQKKMGSVLFLIAFGIIMKQFNQNMTVVLLASVFVTSLFTFVQESDAFKMDGFRSRYKKRKGDKALKEDFVSGNEKVAQYNEIKNTYNDLITTIKAKTAKIKDMTRKIKV